MCSVVDTVKIYVECTSTLFYHHHLNTGIQRLVRTILKSLYLFSSFQSKRLSVEPVAAFNGCFYTLKESALSDCSQPHYRDIHPYASLFRKVLKSFLPASLISSLRNFFAWRRFFQKFSSAHTSPPTVRFNKGDVLFLLDAGWELSSLRSAVAAAKKQGALVGFCLCDLSPLKLPQYANEQTPTKFRQWFADMTQLADFCVSISRSVKREAQTYAQHDLGKKASCFQHIASFTVNVDLDIPNSDCTIRDHLKALYRSDTSPYLAVSTLEPRKNYEMLLDAFDSLWSTRHDVVLVIVGSVGWNCKSLLKRIKNHPLFDRRLFLFHDLTDAELAYCYQHSRALISPSFYEGLGLPPIEALHYRLPVIVSDIPVYRETVSGYGPFFNPSSSASLLRAISRFEKNRTYWLMKAAKFRWITSEQSYSDLIDKISYFRRKLHTD